MAWHVPTGRGGGYGANRSAFTLIELVTVMAVLAIVAAFVGGPTLSYVGSLRSRAAAARIASDIRYIQRVALASGLPTWAVFDVANNRYQLYIEDRANPGKANRQALVHPLDQTTGPVQLGAGPFAGVGIAAANINSTNELSFNSFGVPYDANGGALTASGTIGLTDGVTITVQPVSGFVERSG